MSDWQPIETAPKDGTLVWLIEDGERCGMSVPHQFVGFWQLDSRHTARGYWQMADRFLVGIPTHWMPLPSPPTKDE